MHLNIDDIVRIMKKLLFLIPLILLGLSFTQFSLYKDKVDFLLVKNPNAEVKDVFEAAKKLSPTHWKTLEYNVSFSGSLESSTTDTSRSDVDIEAFLNGDDSTIPQQQNTLTTSPAPEPVHKDAKFKGFPFGAYFTKNKKTSTGGAESSINISAYSWLWATVDIVLIIGTLVLALLMNRKKPKASQMQNMSSNVQSQPGFNQPSPNLTQSSTPGYQQPMTPYNVVSPTNQQQPDQNSIPNQPQPSPNLSYQQPAIPPETIEPQGPTS